MSPRRLFTATIAASATLLCSAALAGGAGAPFGRMDAVAPRFTEPSADPAYVMPVGAGDFSAMLRYDNAWEIHFSKTDFFGWDKSSYHKNPTILSPGHAQLSLGIPREAIRSFSQRLDYARGSVVLEIGTDGGTVKAEAFGAMGRNTLVIAVEDTRPSPSAAVTFSCWRPEMTVKAGTNRLIASEVHDYCENGRPPANPSRPNPADRIYRLGCGVGIAFADEHGPLASVVEGGTLRPEKTPRRYWLIISGATTYDTKPDEAALALLDSGLSTGPASLLKEHLEWWTRFWEASFIDLNGPHAETLMRLWYSGHYSYASVAGAGILPKFNGGPGLINRDDRSWGWGYWWQNTREQIWPMLAANHPEYARQALDFYDRAFTDSKNVTAKRGKLGIRLDEWVGPVKPGTPEPVKQVSAYDAAALDKAVADLSMENVKSGFNARSMAQATELVQLMFDYAAYTGDKEYLKKTVAPWLKEVALFWMSYLRKDTDGLYHSMVTDGAETWWKIKDSNIDLASSRYCFWQVLHHGEEFGYEPAFLAAVKDRADHLAPIPTGQWNRKALPPQGTNAPVQTLVLDTAANLYPAFGGVYDDLRPHNCENPELYIVHPLAIVDGNSPKGDLDRAVNTFRKRRCPNNAGWSPCGVQAARLRLDDAVKVIVDHASRHAKFPYGGWNSPATKMKETSTGATDTPYFDAMGVSLTAIQETLLQSHRLTTPDKSDPPGGGDIVLLPAADREWSGRFRLRARGGFLVTADFAAGRSVTRATIECPRGGPLRLANPFGECRVSRSGKTPLTTHDPEINLTTDAGETVEFVWSTPTPRPAVTSPSPGASPR
jgi:hypothetical protein